MTLSEENYLKVIYHLSADLQVISTNAIADKMQTKASSATDMIKKLSEKGLVAYKKYQGVTLSETGVHAARMIVRKHRLWEVFLVDKLAFAWDEVHEIAEQLEHIQSEELINKLDDFLGNPIVDPHGDAIPDRTGKMTLTKQRVLADLPEGDGGHLVGVKDSSAAFLQYLDKQQLTLGSRIQVLEKEAFDESMVLDVNGRQKSVSQKIARQLLLD
ncbi:metal-dependent transcriptional regulator [Flavobacterium aurantiibacter]|uniref:Transcriptional regulator MntR n=1 Tax=Flavobacterium aurantiibacter TaxID=2023067 RepID=A0A256A4E2_9FLAO|nr:metal-dependent transcriptional regulator [Flavobacterium aurantiibacter]OYQ47964.1 iron-dependent repressor [Flavobacterium aurantiibacter]